MPKKKLCCDQNLYFPYTNRIAQQLKFHFFFRFNDGYMTMISRKTSLKVEV